MKQELKIVVVGSGAFGTALANQFIKNHKETILYGIDQVELKDINENHKNSKYFSKRLNPLLTATDNPDVFTGADVIVIVLPSQVISGVVRDVIVPKLNKKTIFISASKGYDHINQITLVDSISNQIPEEFITGTNQSQTGFGVQNCPKRPVFFWK